jgi:hypothetical protein
MPLGEWLRIIEAEYFSDYIPSGGAAVKFLIADEKPAADLPFLTTELARRHGMLTVEVGAGMTRLHMLHDLFFAIARGTDCCRVILSHCSPAMATPGRDRARR